MGHFLEERLPVTIRIGASAEDSYFVKVHPTSNGSRYPSLINNKPYRTFDVGFLKPRSETALQLAGLFHRTYGGFAGFRVKAWDDFTTANDGVSAYTATDCTLDLISAGVYQLVKEYGRDKPGLSIGRPRRTLFKPLAGKVAFAVAGVAYPAAQWSVDATTGRITLAANKSRAITAISKAASAVLDIGTHSFVVGDSAAVSGVSGMTQINSMRALVTATASTSITLAINSAAFSTYTSGGTVQTRPIAGEAVTGGCEFDIPCAFDSAFSVAALDGDYREITGQRLVELLNP